MCPVWDEASKQVAINNNMVPFSTGGDGEFFIKSFNQPTGRVLDFSGYTTDIKNVIGIF